MSTSGEGPEHPVEEEAAPPADRRRGKGLWIAIGVVAVVAAVAAGIGLGFVFDNGEGSSTAATTSDESQDTAAAAAFAAFRSSGSAEAFSSGAHTPDAALTPKEDALLARLPSDERSSCAPTQVVTVQIAAFECMSPSGVSVLYVQFVGPKTADRLYSLILQQAGVTRGSGTDRCPNGVPSEQPWTQGDVEVGRLTCFTDTDSAASTMIWTHAPLGVVAEADGAPGMAMPAMYTWWSGAPRPSFSEAELAYYKGIPDAERTNCIYEFFGTEALSDCLLTNGVVVSTDSWADPSKVDAQYATKLSKLGVTRDAGACPDIIPGEGPWSASGTQGRVACATDAATGTGRLAWTVDASKTVSAATGPAGMDVKSLYDWWSTANWQVPASGGTTTTPTTTTSTTTTSTTTTTTP